MEDPEDIAETVMCSMWLRERQVTPIEWLEMPALFCEAHLHLAPMFAEFEDRIAEMKSSG